MHLESELVYGPVYSRRFGWDLGINLLPFDRKLCTFDCIYCQYGFTRPIQSGEAYFPEPKEIIVQWSDAIQRCKFSGLKISHTTISGNGEPTMHPHFSEMISELIKWRNQNAPEFKLAVLSNGYRIHTGRIREALQLVDDPIIKLDSASPEKIKTINAPLFELDLHQFIEDLKKFDHIIIQTMFIKGLNDSPEDLQHWTAALKKIRPTEVQIYTVSRSTPVPLTSLTKDELHSIADLTSAMVEVPVHAYV
jgi:wyosine [tRNA(Phe)-imidazoG37] synthetase (radical SAM superfamily)